MLFFIFIIAYLLSVYFYIKNVRLYLRVKNKKSRPELLFWMVVPIANTIVALDRFLEVKEATREKEFKPLHKVIFDSPFEEEEENNV